MSTSSTPLGSRLMFLFAVLATAVVLLLPWWRNHALLRDFYDYGNVMAGAGRIELGDRPYVDFLTPIQTLQFYQAVLAERWFGSRYLSLTYFNALFILVSFAGLTAMLRRPLGRWLALAIAAGIVAGTAVQHTIIWYNALGVVWVAIVVWATARLPAGRGARWATWALVFLVLWLGGMTKLTYQVAALAFAVLFTLRSGFRRELSWPAATSVVAAWVLAGIVLPLWTELALTGASFAQWKHNVLELAGSRMELLKPIGTLGFYWRTPHYYYKPMYLSFVGGWGVVLLGLTAVLVGRGLKTDGSAPGGMAERWFFGLAVFGAAACGLVFLAVHYEIAYVSGAAWLALATGVVVAFGLREATGASRWTRSVLGVGALSLFGTAWASAWVGARALYGHGPLVRSDFVKADDLPARFAYLRGLQIPKREHDALDNFAAYEETLVSEGVPPSSFYFVNATDWMVRVMPEARHRGLPLWLQYGTTFSDVEAPAIADKLKRGTDIQVVVSQYAWDYWPLDFGRTLEARYRRRLVGSLFYVYRLPQDAVQPLGDSVGFVAKVSANLCLKKMTVTGGPVEILLRPGESFVGSARSHQIAFNFGLYGLTGEMIAELQPGNIAARTEIGFRIRLLDGEAKGTLLWDGKIVLTPKETSSIQPFAISPGGNRVALEVEIPPDAAATAGWHKLRTDHAGPLGPEIPGPINGDPKAWPVESWRTPALFAADSPKTAEVHAFGLGGNHGPRQAGAGLEGGAPSELWVRFDQNAGRVTGEYTVIPAPDRRAESPAGARVFVAYYKSGRLEVMLARELHPEKNPADQGRQTFEAWMPEGIGWIGLLVAPLENFDDSSSQIRWENVRVH